MITMTVGQSFEVSGWQGTGGSTLGLRFGSENARLFVNTEWGAVQVELDGALHSFPIRGSFWRKCPEIRGAALTAWLTHHHLAPWPRKQPPRLSLLYLGGNTFRAQLPGAD